MENNQGPLTEAVYYILLSLTKPLHGYGIMQNVSELSKGRVEMGAGTLYGAINTLLSKNWIKLSEDQDDSRKKVYVCTNLGIKTLKSELIRIVELVENGNRIINEVKNEENS